MAHRPCACHHPSWPFGGRNSPYRLPLALACTRLREQLSQAWSSPRLEANPRACASDGKRPGVKMCRYKHWTGGAAEWASAQMWLPHVHAGIAPAQHKRLMRFRLCCWPLAVNRGCSAVARDDRVCTVCNTGAVEDERHVLLECPAYDELRSDAGFSAEADMRTVMMSDRQAELADLLSKIWETRNSIVPFGT